jgi:hypothetical protein
MHADRDVCLPSYHPKTGPSVHGQLKPTNGRGQAPMSVIWDSLVIDGTRLLFARHDLPQANYRSEKRSGTVRHGTSFRGSLDFIHASDVLVLTGQAGLLGRRLAAHRRHIGKVVLARFAANPCLQARLHL